TMALEPLACSRCRTMPATISSTTAATTVRTMRARRIMPAPVPLGPDQMHVDLMKRGVGGGHLRCPHRVTPQPRVGGLGHGEVDERAAVLEGHGVVLVARGGVLGGGGARGGARVGVGVVRAARNEVRRV